MIFLRGVSRFHSINIGVFQNITLQMILTTRKLKVWVAMSLLHLNRKESTKFEQLHEKQKDSRIRTSCGDAA